MINCAAAKLGAAGRLIFKNWIDIARMDPDGPGSRLLAELITWQALAKAYLEAEDAVALADHIQTILRDSNHLDVFTAACQAMCDMDLTPWLGSISSPALVLGGDEDLMTPWDQGPNGVGQEGVHQGIAGSEKHVIRGAGHSTIFDSTEEHARAVIDFFRRHASAELKRVSRRLIPCDSNGGRAPTACASVPCGGQSQTSVGSRLTRVARRRIQRHHGVRRTPASRGALPGLKPGEEKGARGDE